MYYCCTSEEVLILSPILVRDGSQRLKNITFACNIRGSLFIFFSILNYDKKEIIQFDSLLVLN